MEILEDDDTELPDGARLQIRQELCRMMVANGTNSLSGRAMAILVMNHMMKATPETSLTAEIQEIILNPSHVGRLNDGNGPTLGFNLGKKSRGRIPLKTILLQPTKELRSAAIREIETRVAANSSGHPLVDPKTLLRLRGLSSQILNDKIQTAMDAVYQSIELLDNDFFFRVSEVRQTLLLNDDESLASSLKKALHPSPDGVRFITEHPVREPRVHEKQIDELALSICVAAPDLSSFLDKYYCLFGHLPLSGKWSLGQMLNRFLTEHKLNQSTWEAAWDWASEHGSPLASYHVCQAFCSNPSWVEGGQRSLLLLRIAEFAESMLNARSGQYRAMLTRHFRQHLETLEYLADGDLVTTSALWFAEYITCAIESCGTERAAKAFAQIEVEIQPAAEWWTICKPPTTASLLRAGTQLCDSIWVTSLLSELARSELMLSFDEDTAFANSVKSLLRKVSSRELMALESNKTYSLAHSHAILRSRYGVSDKTEKYSCDQDQFGSRLKKFSSQTEDHQEILTRHLLSLAFQGQAPEQLLYEQLSDASWRTLTLASSYKSVAMQIFDALREMGLKQSEKDWPRLIPHFCALACEDENANPSPRPEIVNRLFDFVVQSCVTFNSSSAIDRLFATNQTLYRKQADAWIERLEKIGSGAPRWVLAKCRGVLTALDG